MALDSDARTPDPFDFEACYGTAKALSALAYEQRMVLEVLGSLRPGIVLNVGITFVGVVLFVVSPDSTSLALPLAWSQDFTIIAGLCYGLLFFKRGRRPSELLECYAIGTYSMILVDAGRIGTKSASDSGLG